MNFEDLKESLKSQWEQLLAKIQENPSFVTLKDRFDSLPLQTQKLIQIGAIALGLLILISIPYGTYSNSKSNVESFVEKRDLIRDLLRVSKEVSSTALSVSPPSDGEARGRIDAALNSAGVLPEQKTGINPIPLTGSLIKNSVVEVVLESKVTQLNLTQALNVGLALARIQGTKLKDLLMQPNAKDARYFDVDYKLVVFKNYGIQAGGGLDDSDGPPPPPPPPGSRGGAGRPRGGGN